MARNHGLLTNLSGKRHLWPQNRTEAPRGLRPTAWLALTSLPGVCVKRTSLLKRKLLFREVKPPVAFDENTTKRSFSIPTSLFLPASLHNSCGTPPEVMYSVWGSLDSYKVGRTALLESSEAYIPTAEKGKQLLLGNNVSHNILEFVKGHTICQ